MLISALISAAKQNRYGTADSQQKEISTIQIPVMTTRSVAGRTGSQRSWAARPPLQPPRPTRTDPINTRPSFIPPCVALSVYFPCWLYLRVSLRPSVSPPACLSLRLSVCLCVRVCVFTYALPVAQSLLYQPVAAVQFYVSYYTILFRRSPRAEPGSSWPPRQRALPGTRRNFAPVDCIGVPVRQVDRTVHCIAPLASPVATSGGYYHRHRTRSFNRKDFPTFRWKILV